MGKTAIKLLTLELKLHRCDAALSRPANAGETQSRASSAPGRSKDKLAPPAEESSGEVCWGCLEDEELQEMHVPFNEFGDTYADLIFYCFSMQVTPDPKKSKRKFYVCSACVSRLQESVKFRRQLEVAQSFFSKLFPDEAPSKLPDPACAVAPAPPRLAAVASQPNEDMEIDNDVTIIEDHVSRSYIPNILKKRLALQKWGKSTELFDRSNINDIAICKYLDDIRATNDVFTCPLCANLFPSVQTRRLHLRTLHVDVLPKYLCEECGSSYSSLAHLSAHIREVHIKLHNHRCEHCDATFFRKSAFERHVARHSQFGCYHCAACGCVFDDPRRHRGECAGANGASDSSGSLLGAILTQQPRDPRATPSNASVDSDCEIFILG